MSRLGAWRCLVWSGLLLSFATALWAAEADTPLAQTPQVGVNYLLEPAEGPWQAAQARVVIAVVPAEAQLAEVAARLGPLARERGLVLLTTVGGDDVLFPAVVHRIIQELNADAGDAVLVCAPEQPDAEWDTLGIWTWQVLLRQPGQFAGALIIDPLVPEFLEPVPGQAAATPGQVVLLSSMADRQADSVRLQQVLMRWGLDTLVQPVGQDDLDGYVGAGLTLLVPPMVQRAEITDPTTGATLRSSTGWHFERRDGYFAVAVPERAGSRLIVEIVTGLLDHRTFEGYVEDVHADALSHEWIRVTASERVPVPNDAYVAHRYEATDRRGAEAHGIVWYLLGSGERMVSFRAVGPLDQLREDADSLAEMVFNTRFD